MKTLNRRRRLLRFKLLKLTFLLVRAPTTAGPMKPGNVAKVFVIPIIVPANTPILQIHRNIHWVHCIKMTRLRPTYCYNITTLVVLQSFLSAMNKSHNRWMTSALHSLKLPVIQYAAVVCCLIFSDRGCKLYRFDRSACWKNTAHKLVSQASLIQREVSCGWDGRAMLHNSNCENMGWVSFRKKW